MTGLILDEKDNIIGDGKTILHVNKEHKIESGMYMCSRCLKKFNSDFKDLKRAAVAHHCRCRPLFTSDGIFVVTKEQLKDKRLADALTNIGFLSKVVQGITFQVTCPSKIEYNDSTVFICVADGKLIGSLMVCKRKFKLKRNNIPKEYLFVQDFFVVQYLRRKGFGKKLIDACADYFNTEPRDMLFDSPSSATLHLLHKYYNVGPEDLMFGRPPKFKENIKRNSYIREIKG